MSTILGILGVGGALASLMGTFVLRGALEQGLVDASNSIDGARSTLFSIDRGVDDAIGLLRLSIAL